MLFRVFGLVGWMTSRLYIDLQDNGQVILHASKSTHMQPIQLHSSDSQQTNSMEVDPKPIEPVKIRMIIYTFNIIIGIPAISFIGNDRPLLTKKSGTLNQVSKDKDKIKCIRVSIM
jgi:hypothetical protein